MIINVLLIKPYFVCELRIFHSFIMKRDKPIPLVFCKPDELSDYHTLGLYNLRFNHDNTILTCIIVPQYHSMF